MDDRRWDDDPRHDPDVLNLLGKDSRGIGRYLHALNLQWDDLGVEHDLEHFRRVGRHLMDHPEQFTDVLRTSSWRYTLVGCVCVVLLRPADRLDDLRYRFDRGSFVSPQIAVAIGIVYPEAAVEYLNEFLDRSEHSPGPWKEISSAHSVLDKLGAPRVEAIGLDELDRPGFGDMRLGRAVVEHQWDFWKDRSRQG